MQRKGAAEGRSGKATKWQRMAGKWRLVDGEPGARVAQGDAIEKGYSTRAGGRVLRTDLHELDLLGIGQRGELQRTARVQWKAVTAAKRAAERRRRGSAKAAQRQRKGSAMKRQRKCSGKAAKMQCNEKPVERQWKGSACALR